VEGSGQQGRVEGSGQQGRLEGSGQQGRLEGSPRSGTPTAGLNLTTVGLADTRLSPMRREAGGKVESQENEESEGSEESEESEGVAVRRSAWTCLIRAHAAGDAAGALATLGRMRAGGVPPSIRSLNACARALLKAGRPRDALALLGGPGSLWVTLWCTQGVPSPPRAPPLPCGSRLLGTPGTLAQ